MKKTAIKTRSGKVRLAILDIDGTIFRSSLFLELFYTLVDMGVFPRSARDEVVPYYNAWLNRKGHYNDYLIKTVKVHYKYIVGKPKNIIDRAARLMIARHKDRVYRYTRGLISDLKRRGYYLIAISNSQAYVVEQFARRVGFDASLARQIEIVDGKYTGRVMSNGHLIALDEHMDKVSNLKSFLKEHGLRADFKQSIAVGDSEGDLDMLNLVGHPIAFNPSSGLAKIAKKHGWKIVVERKDVIYDIKKCSFLQKENSQKTKWK